MTQRKIRWLIGLLSVALLGLIGFQFYWINEVSAVNKERFTKAVNDALNEVTYKLAIQNDYNFLQRDANRIMPIQQNRLEALRDTLNRFANNNAYERAGNAQVQNIEEVFNSMLQVEVNEQAGEILFSFNFNAFVNQPPMGYGPMPPTDNSQRLLMERQMNQRMDMLKQSWLEHLMGSNNLFERVNPADLDTLLRRELTNRGIDLEYNYGIIDRAKDELKLLNANVKEDAESIKSSPLKANLFPMDLEVKDYFLAIDFPNERNYLLKQALLPLSASGLLMFIVVGCFAYAIMVILRQKKLSDIKNDFINNMTHEFKTPIATVSLATEALQDDDIKSNKAIIDRYVQVIRDENKRLGMQVEKVLQIASLDKKDFRLKFELSDVHDIIEKALVNITILVEKRGGTITSQLLASNSVIEADRVHLTNIIYNLLDNANKYSPDAPEIHIRTESISTGVIIKISDKGIGMSKEATQKIFDKFYRVSTGNVHDVKGFGLGLSYVKNIVDMHQGSVSVKSEPGKGSTFKVFLPFAHG
ncbi:HAMP domain-containing sensor histidine kinase [Roseivirga sp. UBA838]|uniref:sensor histidine kinase n=1 Tax=Roseivirga sp. UBA838 TaxID=1947393 RepID=UPI00257FAA55|nr:HAMP domain-containing sensor histidine kinase [Roseivirga sp. UBA838]